MWNYLSRTWWLLDGHPNFWPEENHLEGLVEHVRVPYPLVCLTGFVPGYVSSISGEYYWLDSLDYLGLLMFYVIRYMRLKVCKRVRASAALP